MDIIYYLYLLFAVELFGVYLALPVYSSYIISLGGSAFILSLISSSTAFVSLIANPLIGSLSDSNGRRSLLAKCLLCNITGNLLYAIAPSWHFVYLGKIVAAFGSSVGILQKAIVADIIESEQQKRAFLQRSMLIQGLMTVTVSALAGRISEIKYGFSIIYTTIAVGYCLSLVILFTKLPDDTKITKPKESISIMTRSVRELKSVAANLKDINWTRYWDIFALRATIDLGVSVFVTNIGILLILHYDITGSKSGSLYMMVGAAVILANVSKIQLTKLYPRSSEYSLILKCASVLTISFIAISCTPSLLVVYLAMVAFGCSASFLSSVFSEVITVRTTESDRGKVISSFENLLLIAQFIAPFFSGILSFFVSTTTLIALASIPTTITCLIAYRQLTVESELKHDTCKKDK